MIGLDSLHRQWHAKDVAVLIQLVIHPTCGNLICNCEWIFPHGIEFHNEEIGVTLFGAKQNVSLLVIIAVIV